MGVVLAEPKVAASFVNRRLQKRYPVEADPDARLDFHHPAPHGPGYSVRVRDVSLSGLSFQLHAEIPSLHVGGIVGGVDAQIAGKTFRGDLLVMHLTPGNSSGAACGGLFYPESDEDLITIRLVVRDLESREA